jgi:hypothetical protein
MTHSKCQVDCLFPYHVIRCWEPAPSQQYGHWTAYLTPFLGLTLRHRNAVTWTCDQHTWFSFIYNLINFNTLQQKLLKPRESVLSFLSLVLFLWRAAFCPVFSQAKSCFSALPSRNYVMRVALLFGSLAPHLAASAIFALEW